MYVVNSERCCEAVLRKLNVAEAVGSSVFLPYGESLMTEWESYVTSLSHMLDCVTARGRRREMREEKHCCLLPLGHFTY